MLQIRHLEFETHFKEKSILEVSYLDMVMRFQSQNDDEIKHIQRAKNLEEDNLSL